MTGTWSAASSLVVRRCGDSARLRATWPWAAVRHAVLWASTWLELAGGLGRMTEDGGAVLCLEPPRLRDSARFAAVLVATMVSAFALVVVAAGIWPPLAVPPFVAVVALVGRERWCAWRERGVRRRLRAAKPAGAWLLCNFVADAARPGAGRRLLEAVCAEADGRGRTMYLDTVVPRLVEYYAGFGFEERAAAAGQYAGERVTVYRLVRPPG